MSEQRDRRRWLVLGVGLLGLVAGCAAQYGLSYLIPAFRDEGLTLETATLLVTAPIAGVLCALIVWGAAADRWGERRVLTLGLGAAGVAELAAAGVDALLTRWILLFAVGATSAAIHAASGRLILGWFGASERGLAMGIRQMGQPLGVAVAAVVLPPLALGGVGAALSVLAAACLGSAVLIWLVVRDPPHFRSAASRGGGSPYREPYLWRIHAASGLLVIPQFTVAVFAFDYLVESRGWSIGEAGALLAGTQLAGASSRLVVGWWSDRVGSRLGPMRWAAAGIGVVMAMLAVLTLAEAAPAVVALALAAVVTTTPNGLAFTAVAERAGATWAGRALGVQNTVQHVAGVAVAPPLALLIVAAGGGGLGYGLAFASVAAFPFLAALVVPVARERYASTAAAGP